MIGTLLTIIYVVLTCVFQMKGMTYLSGPMMAIMLAFLPISIIGDALYSGKEPEKRNLESWE